MTHVFRAANRDRRKRECEAHQFQMNQRGQPPSVRTAVRANQRPRLSRWKHRTDPWQRKNHRRVSECEWKGQKLTLHTCFKRSILEGSEDDPFPEIHASLRGLPGTNGGNHGTLLQPAFSVYQWSLARTVLEVTKYRFGVSN
jgi:hypothetical protein